RSKLHSSTITRHHKSKLDDLQCYHLSMFRSWLTLLLLHLRIDNYLTIRSPPHLVGIAVRTLSDMDYRRLASDATLHDINITFLRPTDKRAWSGHMSI